MFKKDSILLYSFGGVALIITALGLWNYYTPEWQGYQDEFRELVAKKFGADKVGQVPRACSRFGSKILNRVDRCITCHQGMEWKGWTAWPTRSNRTRRKF